MITDWSKGDMHLEDRGNHRVNPQTEDAGIAASWRETLEENFRLWIQELDVHEIDGEPVQDEPDLYSFYEELSILRTEFRKNARRNHDSFAKFGEILATFDGILKSIAEKTDHEERENQAVEQLSKMKLYLPLVELFERFKRIQQRLSSPPEPSIFSARRQWQAAWESLEDGFGILKDHFEGLLRYEGISSIETTGKSFDPSCMTAVDVLESDTSGPNMVLDEISGGYFYKGNILKLADVRITRSKP